MFGAPPDPARQRRGAARLGAGLIPAGRPGRAGSSARRLAGGGEQAPAIRNPLELVRAAIGEAKAGARHEILHGARYEHLSRLGDAGDARSNVHREASNLAADLLALAGMHAGADVDAEWPHRIADPERATDGACRAVERGEEAIAGRVDLPPSVAVQLPSDQIVVGLQDFAPTAITQLRDPLRRADDVGEEHRGEKAVDLR